MYFLLFLFLVFVNSGDFRDESIYFVITDRFVDGDPSNNNIWGDEYIPGNLRYYQGGDFKGLIDNFDYIKNMGFTAIWITPPIMQPPGRYINSAKTYDAAGYHGYWAWDLSKVDPHLESPGYTYRDLIEKAHKRGLKIIQDVVINHAHGGDVSIDVKWYEDRGRVWGLGRVFDYFNDTYDWFTKDGPILFDLLDFNDKNPEVKRWLIDVYKYWRDMGVDGFRLDTVVWVSSDFVKEFAYEMKKDKPNFFIFGEVWTNSDFNLLSSYTKMGDGSISVLDMPLSSMGGGWGPLEKVFKGGNFRDVLKILENDEKYSDPTYLVVYPDNHDKPRFNSPISPATLNQYINMLNFYFTVRGIPCIYYGTEIMMVGGEDPDNRRMFGIENIKKAKYSKVYKHIKMLNDLRRKLPHLRYGKMEIIYVEKDLFIFRRTLSDKDYIYVLLNKADSNMNIDFSKYIKEDKLFDILKGKIINTEKIKIKSNSFLILKKL
ncbi:MAG: alpha-amylase family glycosyl hydrolase [Elusimicrobiales bacterium]|nr:alpha-amylase family glycosyl hydrolase [Elusimicrobiales bacterium]